MMDFINNLISEELTFALGWTVIHSLWQAMLVALFTAVIMLGLQNKSAKLRYIIYNVALVLVLVLSISTFVDLYQSLKSVDTEEITRLTAVGFVNIGQEASFFEQFLQQFEQYFNAHLPLIVSVWLIGVTFFLLRLFGGLAYLQHLRHHQLQEISTEWKTRFEAICSKVSYKGKIALVESPLVKAPMMIGHFKPIILFPLGAMNALNPKEVEAILAHELAHILRNDYLFNFLQSLIEVLFYFNPAVWWLSSAIRMERENCCDDMAVELCGNSLDYAKALVRLQELSQASPALAMTFSNNKNQLLKRVKRILNHPTNKSNIMEKFTATCLLIGAILLCSLSAQSNTQEPPNPILTDTIETKVAVEPTITAAPMLLVNLEEEEDVDVEYEIVRVRLDTLPKGKIKIEVDTKGQKVDARIEDQQIKYLKIDGKEIPKEEFKDYEQFVEELIEDVEAPPAPPAPPVPPAAIAPAVPVVPGSPPAPPAPPVTPNPNLKSKTIKRGKEGKGQTLIIIESDSGSDSLKITVGEDGNAIFLDGKLFEDGETAIRIDEQDFLPYQNFYFDTTGFKGTFPNSWNFKLDSFALPFVATTPFNTELYFPDSDNKVAIEKIEEARRLQEEILKEYQKKSGKRNLFVPKYSVSPDQHVLKLKNQLKLQEQHGALMERKGNNDFLVHVGPNPMPFAQPAPIAPLGAMIPDAMLEELQRDGFIKNKRKYKIEVDEKGMKVNGKRLTSTEFYKYKQRFGWQKGERFDGNNSITIEKN